jgi:hypothetical protein
MVRNATWQEVRHLVRASYEEQGIGVNPSFSFPPPLRTTKLLRRW